MLELMQSSLWTGTSTLLDRTTRPSVSNISLDRNTRPSVTVSNISLDRTTLISVSNISLDRSTLISVSNISLDRTTLIPVSNISLDRTTLISVSSSLCQYNYLTNLSYLRPLLQCGSYHIGKAAINCVVISRRVCSQLTIQWLIVYTIRFSFPWNRSLHWNCSGLWIRVRWHASHLHHRVRSQRLRFPVTGELDSRDGRGSVARHSCCCACFVECMLHQWHWFSHWNYSHWKKRETTLKLNPTDKHFLSHLLFSNW